MVKRWETPADPNYNFLYAQVGSITFEAFPFRSYRAIYNGRAAQVSRYAYRGCFYALVFTCDDSGNSTCIASQKFDSQDAAFEWAAQNLQASEETK